MSDYESVDWLKRNILRDGGDISELGCEVANLIGDVWMGIYHLENSLLKKANWGSNHHIRLSVHGHLATHDGNLLTRLVVLCHDRMIRLEIAGATHGYLSLVFHQRASRTGSLWERMPTMEDHVDLIRKHYE